MEHHDDDDCTTNEAIWMKVLEIEQHLAPSNPFIRLHLAVA
jgi:hypothetical protein